MGDALGCAVLLDPKLLSWQTRRTKQRQLSQNLSTWSGCRSTKLSLFGYGEIASSREDYTPTTATAISYWERLRNQYTPSRKMTTKKQSDMLFVRGDSVVLISPQPVS